MTDKLALYKEKYGLTDKQVRLAMHYVASGTMTDAAERAQVSYDYGKELLHDNPQFRRCINDLMAIALLDDMVKARRVTRDLLEKPNASDKIILDAAKELWNRAAGEPVRRVVQEHRVDLSDLAERIHKLSRDLGIRAPIEGEVIRDGRIPTKVQRAGATDVDSGVRRESPREPSVALQPRPDSQSD